MFNKFILIYLFCQYRHLLPMFDVIFQQLRKLDCLIEFRTWITSGYLTITISANGIPKREQKHLFEAFFRTHNTGIGTGLKLSPDKCS